MTNDLLYSSEDIFFQAIISVYYGELHFDHQPLRQPRNIRDKEVSITNRFPVVTFVILIDLSSCDDRKQ